MVAISPVRKLGRAVRGRTAGLAASADLPVFLGRVLYHLFVDIIIKRKYGKTLAKQVSDITVGVGALVIGGGMIFVIATMSLATGAMVGLQGYPGLERIGAEAFTGLVASYSNVREVTPIIAGVALVAQVGTGFTAEIGAMRISEEIDALEVMGINSLAYLVCTRVAAGVIALVPLYLVSLFMAFFATRFITIQYFGLSPGIYDYYFHLYLPPIDVFYSVIKVAVFAFIIMFIHCYRGYYAAGGPVGVGVAAGRAIRESTILMILMNLVLSYIFWGHGSTVKLTG
ncbi:MULTISPECIES: ABC transporter permease [Actinomadura]|uniref:Phospholipid/cholesterol/gamma-HCH transport system permease protein n=2 Tax=Actinomadura TaxID=1988 RepID=A0A239I9U7_9ACTN|nr:MULTISPECIES: ABC transporter permease [Actinomadura]QKW38603.1 ABC transporter permease [Actinomadura sp. NAK00032]TMR41474.1 ABC transporter permease [Actinomadura geliboluensis]SNS90410.1 phospholipid/cholesterol/gamma-HCH transport system permease protein [Actinomadura meyerae]